MATSPRSTRQDFKRRNLKVLETYLERTDWGRGIYTTTHIVPAARPAQIKAGARKLYDVIVARSARREQKQAVRA